MELPDAKPPFSLYDYFGHLVPGIYLIGMLFYLRFLYFCEIECPVGILRIKEFVNYFNKNEGIAFLIVLFLIFPYITGRVLSLCSSILLDRCPYINAKRKIFSSLLGLPKKVKPDHFCHLSNLLMKLGLVDEDYFQPRQNFIFKISDLAKIFINFILWVIPILIPLFAFVILFSPSVTKEDVESKLPVLDNFFLIQPLGKTSQYAFGKIKAIIDRNFSPSMTEENANQYFHYLYHYVLENCQKHKNRLYNYYVTYGFMRNMLMGNIFLFYYSIYIWHHSSANFKIYPLLIYAILNVIFLYGYLKFVRRFTEEVIFAACVNQKI